MSHRFRAGVGRLIHATAVVVIVGAAVSLSPSPSRAQDAKQSGGVGRLQSATGTLLSREGPDKPWKAVAKGAAVPDRDLLVSLPGIHAVLTSGNGAAQLTLWGNVPQQSPTPALESAVSLRKSADFDLDLVLDRGRIVVSNLKEKGAARVRVYTQKEPWEISLNEPGAQVSLELNARWPGGVPYRAQYKEGEAPKAEAVLFVLKGTAAVKLEGQSHSMRAPPGPALFAWDSVEGAGRTTHAVPSVPPWAKDGADKEPPAAAVAAALKPLLSSLAAKAPDAALADALAAADKENDGKRAALLRELAVTGMGAIDDLNGLVNALIDPKHPDERAAAIETLRHWIGRKPGQDAVLSRFLVRERKYSPEHATIGLQLLHSYGRNSIEDPLTYELLIAYLQHDKLAIRELAAWHLYRLAPAGQKIPYDPAGTKEKREAAVKAWKALIPSGQLPPRPRQK